MEKDCGFSNGYLNPKKLEKIPYDRAKTIADYLGVSEIEILDGPEVCKSKRIMASNIKRYMDIKGVTNQQLCDALGFKYTTFMDWVKGVTYPRIGKIEAMADYFGCKKSDLIEEKASFVSEDSRLDRSAKLLMELPPEARDEAFNLIETIKLKYKRKGKNSSERF